jgi:predicted CXXCH cytochrome family protein
MRHLNVARALVVVTLALGMLLAASSLALANTESGYVTWTADVPNNNSMATPHKDYQTTTQKCAVCHAVHKAPADGELLLRGAASDSCVYCHITNSTGVIQIYNGNSSLYYVDNSKNHSRDGGAPCNGCHAVHGADTYGGTLTAKILKRLPIQPALLAAFSVDSSENVIYNMDPGTVHPVVPDYAFEDWYGNDVQQTAFCSGCHPYYTRASEESIETTRMIVNGAISTEATSFASHPMKRYKAADGDPDFQADGSTLPSDTMVASMSTNGCHRCHGESAYLNQPAGLYESSFPHYTASRDRFLVSSDIVGGTIGTQDSTEDGTCFWCHLWKWGNPPGGVGDSY